MVDDNPIAAALDLKAPESTEPKLEEGGVTAGLKLFRNTILDLRNLLVAFVLLAVICGSFGYLKEKSPAAFWIAIALAGLCGVVAVWETILLVQRRHRDKALKSWAVTPLPSFRDDYFRVGPYDSADKDRYNRTDGANRAVIKWVRAAETPLLYLSGMSGTGKSSLINASLIPALEHSESGRAEMPFVVIRVREFGDPLAQTREAVLKPGKIWKNPPAAYAHDDFISVFSAVCDRLKNDNKRLLLLFDQFEVVLIRHDQGSEETKPLQELFATVRAGARKRFPNLTVLLSFRSDYDHLLKQLGLAGQIEDENSKKISAFSRGAASNFLTDPASGLQLGSERAKAVLDEAEAVDGTRGVDGLKELKALQSLNLSRCRQLRNVDGLKELKALQKLNLRYCDQLQNVDGLKQLQALQSLNLSYCDQLQNVEAVATSLPNLKYLDLRGTPVRDRTAILALKSKLESLGTDFDDSEESSPSGP